jgi:HipA-like protein
MIDVYVNQQKVGTLSKEGREYVFTYHTTAPALFVSLTMPVRERSYVFSHDQLHQYLINIYRKDTSWNCSGTFSQSNSAKLMS